MTVKKSQAEKLKLHNFTDDDDFPKPCKIIVSYDKTLQKITGKKEEEMIVSEGISFLLFLGMIFSSYPAIEFKYPPGVLGFTVNGKPPDDFEILNDGDKIFFTVGSEFIGTGNYCNQAPRGYRHYETGRII